MYNLNSFQIIWMLTDWSDVHVNGSENTVTFKLDGCRTTSVTADMYLNSLKDAVNQIWDDKKITDELLLPDDEGYPDSSDGFPAYFVTIHGFTHDDSEALRDSCENEVN